jgi:hypothetical protein
VKAISRAQGREGKLSATIYPISGRNIQTKTFILTGVVAGSGGEGNSIGGGG